MEGNQLMEDERFDVFERAAGQIQQSDRDRPITGAWRLRQVSSDGRLKKRRLAYECLLGDLMVAYQTDPNSYVSYSRRREFYASRRSRYWPSELTYANIIYFVDEGYDWAIEHMKSKPGQHGRQSRMRLRESAAIAYQRYACSQLIYAPPETILLKDREDKLIDYRDDGVTKRMRSNLAQINETFVGTRVG